MKIISKWHDWLGMPKFDRAWHKADIKDELTEYEVETKLLKKWSEASDVVYTYTRSKWSGYELVFPLGRWLYIFGVIYMIPKYTGRFLFFRSAGHRAGADKTIRCVRNPKKLKKLDAIIKEQNIKVDSYKLRRICQKRRRYWPLLP